MLLSVGVGCHPQRPLDIELGDRSTLVFLVERLEAGPGEARFAIAEVRTKPLRAFTTQGDVRITVYAYDRAPSEVGLEVGPITFVGPGTRRRALPRPDLLLSGPPEAIVRTDEPPVEVAALRVKNLDPLPTFGAFEEIELPESWGHVRQLAGIGPDAAIVMTGYFDDRLELDPKHEHARAYRVDAYGAQLLPTWTGTPAHAVFGGPGESVWIAPKSGGLVRFGRTAPGEVDRILETVPLPSGAADNRALKTVGATPDHAELWAITEPTPEIPVAATLRRRGAGFEVVSRDPAPEGIRPTGIYPVSPGHAFAIHQRQVFEYEGDQPRAVVTPIGIPFGFSEITDLPGLGYVLTGEAIDLTGRGGLYLGQGGVFEELIVEGTKEKLMGNGPETVVAFAGGFLAAADNGECWFLTFFDADADGRPLLPLGLAKVIPVGAGNYYFAVPIGDRMMVGGRQGNLVPNVGDPASVYLITATR